MPELQGKKYGLEPMFSDMLRAKYLPSSAPPMSASDTALRLLRGVSCSGSKPIQWPNTRIRKYCESIAHGFKSKKLRNRGSEIVRSAAE